jgi:hypothetical protein
MTEVIAINNNVAAFSQRGTTLTLEYGIPIFLAMVFVAAFVSSKTKIPVINHQDRSFTFNPPPSAFENLFRQFQV